MYAQWLRVVDENRALVSENTFLIDFKDKSKKKVQVLEMLVAEKDDRIKEIHADLERTYKNLKMLNLGSAQLDQILSKGKFTGNQQGLDYKGECSNSKTIFVKSDYVISSIVSPVLKNRKLVASSVTIENSVENITTEQKSRMCAMKCRSSASSNLGNGASVATKGKLAATQTKICSDTDSHKFRKAVATDFKLAAHFLSFVKTDATSQKLVMYSQYVSAGNP